MIPAFSAQSSPATELTAQGRTTRPTDHGCSPELGRRRGSCGGWAVINQGMSTIRAVISTDSAPRAIGPYSQAVRAGNLLFCSGQIALDPASGTIVGGDDVAAQTRQVLANLQAVIEAAGGTMGSIVKTTIFLADMNDFATVNAVYGERFVSAPPARATVEVSRLPKDVKVEIEAIAWLD